MADAAVAITAGSGTSIDTRTEATNGNHRQVVVVGDPTTNAGVAPVDATAGLKVDLGADNDVTVTGTVTANLSATDNAVLDAIEVDTTAIASDTAAIKTAVEIIDNAIAGSEMQVDVITLPTLANVTTVGTVSTLTGGGVAHDAADSGNPIKVGAKAESTPSTATMVADGDRTDLYADLDGALLVRQIALGDLISEAVSNTDGASTAFTNFGATASTRSYITAYSIFRTDAGTTPIYVDFRDGTAGSVLYRVVIPPNGGANVASAIPLFRTTANTALAFDVSAATTTVYISVSGYKSKV